MTKKTLKELTISDNFMFGAVMIDEENCRLLLERILGFPIANVQVNKEQSIIYHPEYKGVRLDIYAKDNNACYNIEMQAVKDDALGKRSRYYHSQMDMELLLRGKSYAELSNAYVIFICDFDPFKKKKYCYTFKNVCQEHGSVDLEDGSVTIFLSTKGRNREETRPELIKFLEFAGEDLKEAEKDFADDFVERLQKSVQWVKEDRDLEARYMLFQEMLNKEYGIGKAEGKAEERATAVLEVLRRLGKISENLEQRILAEKDLENLKRWFFEAISCVSLEQFIEKM